MIPNYNLFCSAVKDISKKRYSDFLVIHIYLNMFFNLLNFWSAFFVQFFFSQLDSLGSFNRRRATLRILLNKAIIYLFIYLFIYPWLNYHLREVQHYISDIQSQTQGFNI